ncbi:MAG: glycosyltransferase family 39 protein [Anaerolineaceae bacterium]|nr:glycosyltransferase family 39 protein [Anaerolineaceae bacterium]
MKSEKESHSGTNPNQASNSSKSNAITSSVFGMVFGVLISGIILWVKKITPMEEKIEKMTKEKEQLSVQLLQQNNMIQTQVEQSHFSWEKHWPKVILAAGAIILSLIGPVFVILHRWLDVRFMLDLSRDVWCMSPFLCQTILPSYFLYVGLSIIALIVLLLFAGPKVNLPFKASFPFQQSKINLSRQQYIFSNVIGSIALIGIAVDISLALFFGRNPGAEFAFYILCYVVFCYIREFSWQEIYRHIKSIPNWVIPFMIFLLGLLGFIQAAYDKQASMLIPLLLLGAGLVFLIPQRKKIPLIMWISLGCLLLFVFLIGSWRYSVIGDEYAFLGHNKAILSEENPFLFTLKNLLNPKTMVHGKFVYLSILPNIITMEMFGSTNFGWRIVNPLLCFASLPFFYLFIKRFMNRRMAILFTILMTGSHLLINFSKIGYNNLTGLFSLSVLLWLTGKALDVNRNFGYTLLGLCLGLCLYSYPAILAVMPISLLLLLLYNPPFKSKTSTSQWFLLIVAFFLLLFPTLVEPDYWADKILESSVASSIVSDHQFHFFSNLLYTFFAPFYAPEDTHFVVISFLDAISCALLLFGFGSILKQRKNNRFAWFTLLSYLFLFISLGASRDRHLPSATHFFLYLPIWWMIVVYGIDYVSKLLFFDEAFTSKIKPFQTGLMITIVALNLFQAYGMSPQHSKQYYSVESLLLRFFQQVERENVEKTLDFLFITDADWNIFGIRDMQHAYQLPPEDDQLQRSPIFVDDIEPDLKDDPHWVALPIPENNMGRVEPKMVKMEDWALQRVQDHETVIVINPLPADEYRVVLENTMLENDRQICELSSGPDEGTRLTMWIHESWMWLCPVNGGWKRYW